MIVDLDNCKLINTLGRMADAASSGSWFACQAADHVVQFSACLGITVYQEHGKNAATLISRADEAMYVPGQEEQRRPMPAVAPENHL